MNVQNVDMKYDQSTIIALIAVREWRARTGNEIREI